MKRFIAITITTLALLIAPVTPAFAQNATNQPSAESSGQALEIGPPVLNLTGDPGELVKARLSLRDVAPVAMIVTNEINDFVAGGEDGIPKILLKEGEESPYSMKEWITPLPRMTLKPKEVRTITVSIKIPQDAAPGGYYSVIRFTGTPKGVDGNGVALSASLGALVLLKVNGEAREDIRVDEFYAAVGDSPNWLFQSAPINFVTRVKNNGTIHGQPTGQITITDMFGNVVATVPVNADQRNVLPGSVRKFDQALTDKDTGGKFLFGKYTAKLELAYGTDVYLISSSVDVWVIPYGLVAIVLGVLVALGLGIRFGLLGYKKRVLRQTRGSRRR